VSLRSTLSFFTLLLLSSSPSFFHSLFLSFFRSSSLCWFLSCFIYFFLSFVFPFVSFFPSLCSYFLLRLLSASLLGLTLFTQWNSTLCLYGVHTSSKDEDEKGFASAEGELGTPESLPEPERPPLRHIDKYIRPECPCLSKRYTMAVLTCVGTACCSCSRRNESVTKINE
jgi:hypothetical protein